MATAPISPSPDHIRRLTYSKYLLRRARTLQREGNEVATAEATLLGHDAAEMMMRVVVEAVKAKWESFMGFWQSVTDKVGTMPPDKDALKRFDELRAGFKHFGNLPHPNVASDLLTIVENFCQQIAKQYLNVDLDLLSLADLIQNEAARKEVKKAETAFANGDMSGAFLSLGTGFDELEIEAFKKIGVAVEPPFHFGLSGLSGPIRAFASGFEDKIRRELDRLRDATNMLALGIKPQVLRRFQTLTPHRFRTGDGSTGAAWTHDPQKLGKTEFEFCHSFVVDFGLRLAAQS